jgi:hypothetical protein
MPWVPQIDFQGFSHNSDTLLSNQEILASHATRNLYHHSFDASTIQVPTMLEAIPTESTYHGIEKTSHLTRPSSSAVEVDINHFVSELDVNNLIERLARRAVCLGPIPGLRKEDIDLAIMESIHIRPPSSGVSTLFTVGSDYTTCSY